ncbi:hypothetical protein CsSME_00030254 [Camellia sinensis var. sinensis]
MTEDFGNNEIQDDSSESSQDNQQRQRKRKKKKRAICKNCYPDEEYKEFEAVQVIKLSPQARIPFRATTGAVGYDLSSIATYVVPPQGRTLISTGIAIEILPGTYGRIAPRSGLAFHSGIDVGAGVIDPDYRGEIKVLLFNHDKSEPFIIQTGDRIAQIIFEEVAYPRMVLKDALNLRDMRSEHLGFGSTGKETASEQQDWDSDPNLTQSSNLLAMLEEQEVETEYPQVRKLEQLIEKYSKKKSPEYLLSSSSTAVSNYQPPQDSMMGPPGYPPATGNTAIPIPQRPAYGNGVPRFTNFRRDPKNEWWNLPSAMHQTGAIFVIPHPLGKFDDVFMRWESITKIHVAMQGFIEVRNKIMFIENLLGETEKLMWTQWHMAYTAEYEALVASGDGDEGTQNIISQMRTVFTLEDPYQGSTLMQEEAYRDLERLSCKDVKDIIKFLNDYLHLATRTGRLFVREELSEKLWTKMPGDLGERIKKAFSERYPGNIIGVGPRILFSYKYLEAECKNAAFQKSLRNLDFCKEIPIPGYYKETEKKKYGLRKATTYKGKPHPSHVRIDKRKYL